MANSRHCDWTGQVAQTALASAICVTAGPVTPTGKNRSLSTDAHDAWARQWSPHPQVLVKAIVILRRNVKTSNVVTGTLACAAAPRLPNEVWDAGSTMVPGGSPLWYATLVRCDGPPQW